MPRVCLEPGTIKVDGALVADGSMDQGARNAQLSQALRRRQGSDRAAFIVDERVDYKSLAAAYQVVKSAGFKRTHLDFLPGVVAADAEWTPGADMLVVVVEPKALELQRRHASPPQSTAATAPQPSAPATAPAAGLGLSGGEAAPPSGSLDKIAVRAGIGLDGLTQEKVSGKLRQVCANFDGCDRGNVQVLPDVSVGTLKRVLGLVTSAASSLGAPLALQLKEVGSVTTVSGRLAPEVIQRTVRQNFGHFRMCYEAGLGRNPKLEGRVSARFVIARDGSVQNVSDAGSDMPDPEVVACVLKTFYTIKFPAPDEGIVTVVYPIRLAPG